MERLMVCLLMLAAGCANSKESTAPGDTPFAIIATDGGFAAPDTLHAGLNHFTFENRGTDIHECAFIRLPAGMSAADYSAAVDSGVAFPKGAVDCSGPGLTSPGEGVEMWLPLEEGRYMLWCWKRHPVRSTPRIVVVSGAGPAPVQPPHHDVIVRMLDFRFELIGEIERGAQTIRFETPGPSMHEADIYRLDDGRSLTDLRAWQQDRDRLPLPGKVAGGVLSSHDLSRVVWVRREFTAGRYVLWCGMPILQTAGRADSAAAHATHDQAGMVKEFVVD